jgi:hypothetical protein
LAGDQDAQDKPLKEIGRAKGYKRANPVLSSLRIESDNAKDLPPRDSHQAGD